MHIEHGSWHGPILDYYNMAFYVQILQIFRAFLGELLAMQRPITDFGILGMTQADLWKTYPKPISLEQRLFDRFWGLAQVRQAFFSKSKNHSMLLVLSIYVLIELF